MSNEKKNTPHRGTPLGRAVAAAAMMLLCFVAIVRAGDAPNDAAKDAMRPQPLLVTEMERLKAENLSLRIAAAQRAVQDLQQQGVALEAETKTAHGCNAACKIDWQRGLVLPPENASAAKPAPAK